MDEDSVRSERPSDMLVRRVLMKIRSRHIAVGFVALVGAFCALKTSLAQSPAPTQMQPEAQYREQAQGPAHGRWRFSHFAQINNRSGT